jgi:hypothetical protein
MSLKLGDEFPNFPLKTTIGEFQLHDWLNDRSIIFFFLLLIKFQYMILVGVFYFHIQLIIHQFVQRNYHVLLN